MVFDKEEKEYLVMLTQPIVNDVSDIKNRVKSHGQRIDQNCVDIARIDERTHWLEGIWWKIGAAIIVAIAVAGIGVSSGAVP